MNKDKFLTRRWNTIISLVQGLPTFAFIAYGIFSPLGGTLGGMIAISVVGACSASSLNITPLPGSPGSWKNPIHRPANLN
jgi:hypothetical protein